MPISNPLKLLRIEDLNLRAGAYLDTGTDEGELVTVGAIADQVVSRIMDEILVGQLAYFPAGGSLGAKWLLCDGSSFDGLQYPRLAAFLGSTQLPDLRDRFLLAGGARTPGETGGEAEHVLDTAELPVQLGYVSDAYRNSVEAAVGFALDAQASFGGFVDRVIVDAQPGQQNLSVWNPGGGNAHNNMPPYVVARVCIYAA